MFLIPSAHRYEFKVEVRFDTVEYKDGMGDRDGWQDADVVLQVFR
jgi:hypothetical protein